MPEENVRVAVRVRPFNSREKGRNAQLIIGMNGSTTTIAEPGSSEEPKKFNFDFSYWSHDGCKADGDGYFGPDTSHANGKKFADQKKVYGDLGVGVLNNAWEGYNSTLFAYGQTGSGKSWSMVGYGINKGIVPMFCDNIFKQIDEKKNAGEKIEFEVSFSMLEIYNEQVRDLLDNNAPKRGGLKVRQHPKKGFYAEGLKITAVNSYAEIEKRMEEGTTNRTVASTNMNATSSRAHTIVGITFVQKFVNAAGEETAKTAVINLVDLAGSERAESTGATGDRLKEGAAINQSLSCLGNCIAALAEKAGGKNTRVPYRDSVLTKLLKNALGGNSKTIMIAALSPADINFEETLSTLRYADRAKQIKTVASVNEDPTEKLIRELQEENEKLKKMLESGDFSGMQEEDDDMTDEERAKEQEDFAKLMDENAKEMEEMKRSFEDKLREARESGGGGSDIAEREEKKKKIAHLSNLNPDPQLTGHIIIFIEGEKNTLGTDKENANISVRGPSIQPSHAFIHQAEGVFSVEPAVNHAKILHNGKTVGSKTDIKHMDRLQFGTTQLFVFCNPAKADPKVKYPDITYEFAQEEINKKSGLDMGDDQNDGLLQDEILEILPKIETANSYSEDLNKKVKFTMIVTSPESRGEAKGRSEVYVKVTNMETKYEWLWPKEKMLNRFFKMSEMYEDFEDGDEWDKKPEEDPFLDDTNSDCYIGCVKIWLQSLSYMIESKEQLKIVDIQGKDSGYLNYEIVPCDAKGKEYTENDDVFVDNPDELLGKDLHFKIKLTSARGLPTKYSDAFATYTFMVGAQIGETKRIAGTNNPDWNFAKQHDLPKISMEALDYVKDGAVMIKIYGKQKVQKPKKTIDTKQAMLKDHLTRGQSSAAVGGGKMDLDKAKYMMEAAMLRRRTQQLELKIHSMKKMLEVAEQNSKKRISIILIKQIYNAPTEDAANKCIAMIPQEKDEDDDDDVDVKNNGKSGAAAGAAAASGSKSKKGGHDSSDSSSSSSASSDSDNDDKEKKEKKRQKRKRKDERRQKKQEKKQEKKQKEKENKQKSPSKSLVVPQSARSTKSNQKSSSCVVL